MATIEAIKVDTRSLDLRHGKNFKTVNPKTRFGAPLKEFGALVSGFSFALK